MQLTDIIALAKAGYKVSDIKELMALESSEETTAKVEEKVQTKVKEEQEVEKEQSAKASEKVTVDSTEDNAIDIYKTKITELENKISQLQADNVHKDVSDKNEKSDIEIANDFVRNFM